MLCQGKADLVSGNSRRKEAAFTLVELLCVVALLGMMTAIALPLFQDIGRKRNLEIAARTMATDMRRCQQAAILTGKEHYIEFLIYYDLYQYRINTVPKSKTEKVKFPEGVYYRSTTIANTNGIPRLSFGANGAPGSAGTVVLRNTKGDVLYVIVTPATGRVRISSEPPDHWEVKIIP